MEISKKNLIKIQNKEIEVKELFPELFNPFKNGDWVIKSGRGMMKITDFENSKGFGIIGKYWRTLSKWSFKSCLDCWRIATPEEVLKELSDYAIIKGYKIGNFNCLIGSNHRTTNGFEISNDCLCLGSDVLMDGDGKWVEIVEKDHRILDLIAELGKDKLINIIKN